MRELELLRREFEAVPEPDESTTQGARLLLLDQIEHVDGAGTAAASSRQTAGRARGRACRGSPAGRDDFAARARRVGEPGGCCCAHLRGRRPGVRLPEGSWPGRRYASASVAPDLPEVAGAGRAGDGDAEQAALCGARGRADRVVARHQARNWDRGQVSRVSASPARATGSRGCDQARRRCARSSTRRRQSLVCERSRTSTRSSSPTFAPGSARPARRTPSGSSRQTPDARSGSSPVSGASREHAARSERWPTCRSGTRCSGRPSGPLSSPRSPRHAGTRRVQLRDPLGRKGTAVIGPSGYNALQWITLFDVHTSRVLAEGVQGRNYIGDQTPPPHRVWLQVFLPAPSATPKRPAPSIRVDG